MKIFISYRRKSSAFTLLLANKLSEQLDADIFVDFESIDESDFETAILRHLNSSDVFLLMITEHTFEDRIHKASDWVRKEIRTALERKMPIILVCENGLFPPADIPDDIREIRGKQGIEFYPAYFDAAVIRLVNFLGKAASIPRKTGITPTQDLPVPQEQVEELEVDQSKITAGNARQILAEAIVADDAKDFGRALFLYEALQDIGYTSNRFDISALIEQIRKAHEHEERKRLATLDYEEIALFAKSQRTLQHALKEFKQWSEEYPEFVEELDTEKLVQKTSKSSKITAKSVSILDILPQPFAWIDIPAGEVTLEERGYVPKGGQTFNVPAFQMAKYPITKAQYSKFIEAGGYSNKKWWTEAGWDAREKGYNWDSYSSSWKPTDKAWTEPRFWTDQGWNGADYPVVGVSWYEAIAFCNWLNSLIEKFPSPSEAVGRGARGEGIITLPTEQQWQRAAQGDDNRLYPWGNKFDENRCNTKEGGINKTTPVTQYEGKGDSPFGVVDMVGNIWEWSLTDFETGMQDFNSDATSRVLRGGSFYDILLWSRATFRFFNYPYYWFGSYGFRCVCAR